MTSYIEDKKLTIALSGEIDHHKAKELMNLIARKMDEYLPKSCVLDFQDVSFMDSSGIAVVIHSMRRMRELGGKVKLRNIQQQPMKILRAAGIEQVAEIEGRKPL